MGIKDALASGAGKTAKFENIGDFVEGTVISADLKPSTMPGGAPRTFDDGSPQFDFVFQLQTNLRDSEIENDDGIRSVWMRSFGDDKKAVLEAVTAAGDDDVNPGGWMKVTLTGTIPSKTPGFQPRKVRSVEYRKPQGAVGQAAGVPSQNPQQGQPQQGQFQPQGQPQQGGQQWGQNPQQAQPQQGQFQQQAQPQQGQPQQPQQAQQAQPQQGNPWGNSAPQNVQQQGQPQQAQQQGNPWGNSDQQQNNGSDLTF